jgi:hypothetical protein
MLLKFLLIIGLVLYAVYKVGSFFFRAGAASQQLRDQQRKNYNAASPNGKDKAKTTHFKGGEYVDYEDVK